MYGRGAFSGPQEYHTKRIIYTFMYTYMYTIRNIKPINSFHLRRSLPSLLVITFDVISKHIANLMNNLNNP